MAFERGWEAHLALYRYVYHMYNSAMRFQLDPNKAAGNLKKHGVSFADAEGVFIDPLAIHSPDPDAPDEDLVYCGGDGKCWGGYGGGLYIRGDEIRLISARCATRHEVRDYEG